MKEKKKIYYITIVDCWDTFESPNITSFFKTKKEAEKNIEFQRKHNEWYILGKLEILEEKGEHI